MAPNFSVQPESHLNQERLRLEELPPSRSQSIDDEEMSSPTMSTADTSALGSLQPAGPPRDAILPRIQAPPSLFGDETSLHTMESRSVRHSTHRSRSRRSLREAASTRSNSVESRRTLTPPFSSDEIPRFTGGGALECEAFIVAVRNWFVSNRIQDTKEIAMMVSCKLGAAAFYWHARLPRETQEDWNQLQNAMISEYCSPDGKNARGSDSQLALSPYPTPLSPTPSNVSDASSRLLSPGPSTTSSSWMMAGPESSGLSSRPISPLRTSSPKPITACGRLRLMDYTGTIPMYYIHKDVNYYGNCKPTKLKHEALAVKVNSADHPRQLQLESSSTLHTLIGVTWRLEEWRTPQLGSGSMDRAELVFLHHNGMSSATSLKGPSRDAIWEVGEKGVVKILWADENGLEHDLHLMVKVNPGMFHHSHKLAVVKDVHTFMSRHSGYVPSRLVFEPM